MHEIVSDREFPVVPISIDAGIKTYTPEQLTGLFFRGVKNMVEEFAGQEVSDVIVTTGLASTDLEKVQSLWMEI
jgi:molecular chaperone DnaK (HSP70)